MGDIGLIAQVVVNGILFGSMYGIAAIGLSLIFGTMRIVFIAQGAVIVLFAYFCFWLFSLLGIDPYLSLIPIILAALLLGTAFYYGLFREAAAFKDRIGSLLIAVGVMFFLENFMTVIWTPNPRAIVTSYGFYTFRLWELHFTLVRVIGLVIAVLATIAVATFLKKTLIGTAVRATSEDVEASTLMGINPNRVNAVTFAIGIGLAGLAGITLATTYSFDPMYGIDFAIKALVALTLGGIGRVSAAFLGGIILGLIELLGTFFVGAAWSQAIVFAVFLLALNFRPQGLFGGATSDKA
jgi:branched-chain amino acid transport system permease protein